MAGHHMLNLSQDLYLVCTLSGKFPAEYSLNHNGDFGGVDYAPLQILITRLSLQKVFQKRSLPRRTNKSI